LSAAKACVLLGVSVALAGCVTRAQIPNGATAGADYAAATFELGITDTVGLGNATTQEYRIGDTQDFKQSAQVKIFTWVSKSPKEFLLRTGRTVFVFSKVDRSYGAPGISASGYNTCKNISSFAPQPFARYRVVQTGDAFNRCELQIIDLATGKRPDDLKMVLFPRAPEDE
jgi:hypothetical protein